ncbi:MAG: hypothetical protein RLZZ578_1432 [Bacteroidota bacterium]
MQKMQSIAERWKRIEHEVQDAALSCGRNPHDITIVAVSKMHSLEYVQQAYDAGARVFGENYAQEFRDKIQESQSIHFIPEWHFIGALQSNKVKYVIPHAALIHSCSSVSVADEIQRLSKKLDVITPVLVQVNTSGETSKSGIEPDRIDAFMEQLQGYENIKPRGLMTIPTATDDDLQLIKEFTVLRTIHERLKQTCEHPNDWNILSMGMSDDFNLAIREGATHVRIGTAIFGERNQ